MGLLIPAAMKRPPKAIPLKTIHLQPRPSKAMSRVNCLWMMSPPKAAPRWNSLNQIFRKPISLNPKLRLRRTRTNPSAMTKRRTKRTTKIPITPVTWIQVTMILITMSIHTITKMNIIRNITMIFKTTTTANTATTANTSTLMVEISVAMKAVITVAEMRALAAP